MSAQAACGGTGVLGKASVDAGAREGLGACPVSEADKDYRSARLAGVPHARFRLENDTRTGPRSSSVSVRFFAIFKQNVMKAFVSVTVH